MGKRAEGLAQYLVKGKEIIATGEIEQDRWEDKNTGDKKSRVIFYVRSIDFTSGSKVVTPEGQGNYNNPKTLTSGKEFDDIPF